MDVRDRRRLDFGPEALYRRHARAVRRIVGASVRAPEPTLDDACQIAWQRYLRRRDQVKSEAVLSWLVTTARREALKLSGSTQAEQSLEAIPDEVKNTSSRLRVPGADEVVEQRARLEEIGTLPHRQQQLMWLHGMGFNYVEMASKTGSSRRTVERKLLRAKRALGATGRGEARSL
jgi:RNA polymerase sigma factor (sigma-70 family)